MLERRKDKMNIEDSPVVKKLLKQHPEMRKFLKENPKERKFIEKALKTKKHLVETGADKLTTFREMKKLRDENRKDLLKKYPEEKELVEKLQKESNREWDERERQILEERNKKTQDDYWKVKKFKWN
jgi:hypothetical protein